MVPHKPECPCTTPPITLESPEPVIAGPCTTNDKNYNSRYECSEEIELDHPGQSGGSRTTVGFPGLFLKILFLGLAIT